MGSRLSKNILQIGLIESGSLATFWSDWRNVIKVIANFLLSETGFTVTFPGIGYDSISDF